MSNFYDLFIELSKEPNPEVSEIYKNLVQHSPKKASKLLNLLSHKQKDADLLFEKIYEPLMQMDDPDNRIGRLINGKYRLIELIGQGGMSDVYKAERIDGLIEQVVAVKYFSLAHSYDDAMVTIKGEAQILEKLDHQHIASFIDVGFDETGEPNILMEYIAGETLHRFLQSNPEPKTLKKIEHTFRQALAHAESKGVKHGDISLNNVLVDHDGNANIIDFDIASTEPRCVD